MRVILFLFTLLLTNNQSSTAQINWEWANPPTTSNSLLTVNVFDSLKIMGFGEAGTILKTTDFGFSWKIEYQTQIIEDINGSFFSDENDGFVCCNNGKLYFTKDGADSWIEHPSITTKSLNDIHFNDTSLGAISGDSGIVLISTDKGKIWQKVLTPTHKNLNGIFVGKKVITAVGDSGLILQSVSEGKYWKLRNRNTQFDLNAVAFYDNNFGIAGGDSGTVLITSDGGLNWTKDKIAKGRHIFDVIIKSEGEVICASERGLTARTDIKMINWQNRYTGSIYDLLAINIIGDNYGAIVGQYGNLHSTKNGFKNIYFFFDHSHSTYKNLFDVKMGSENFAITVGWNGTLMQTLDYCSSWYKASAKGADEYRGIEILDDSICWAVGEDGSIRYSENKGESWDAVYSQVKNNLNDVKFFNPSHGLIAGNEGTIFETNNGGEDWEKIDLKLNDDLNSVSFSSDGYPLVVGDSGLFITKYNGKWNLERIDPKKDLLCIDEYNGEIIVGGESGLILRSTNGGSSWINISAGTTIENLNGIKLFSDDLSMIVGNKGTVLISRDAGSTWQNVHIPTNNDLYGIDIFSEDRGIVVGLHGTVLKFRLGEK